MAISTLALRLAFRLIGYAAGAGYQFVRRQWGRSRLYRRRRNAPGAHFDITACGIDATAAAVQTARIALLTGVPRDTGRLERSLQVVVNADGIDIQMAFYGYILNSSYRSRYNGWLDQVYEQAEAAYANAYWVCSLSLR